MSRAEEVFRALELSLSNNANDCKEGEAKATELRSMDEVGYFQSLCTLIESPNIDHTIRITALIQLKNAVRRCWQLEDETLKPETQILLKQVLVPLTMKTVNSQSREFLIECVRIIAEEEFPIKWASPLPDLLRDYIVPFNSRAPINLELVLVSLRILQACLSKYAFIEATNDILRILKQILDISQEVIFTALKTSAAILCSEQNSADHARLRQIGKITVTCLDLVRILHGVDLPEYFEDRLSELSEILVHLMNVNIPEEFEAEDEDEMRMSDDLKSKCYGIIDIYVTKYSEEFQPHIRVVLSTMIKSLAVMPNACHADECATQGLTALHHAAFIAWPEDKCPFNEQTLAVIVENIIKRTMALRESDLETMAEEPLSFVMADVDGLSRAARRDALQNLISILIIKFPTASKRLIAICQQTMTTATSSSLDEECLCFLVACLCTVTHTRARGATQVRRFEDALAYINSRIVPALSSSKTTVNINQALVLASYLKFVAFFRNFVPQQLLEQIVILATPFVQSESIILHSYVCYLLEKTLLLKYDTKTPFIRYNEAHIQKNLCACLPFILQRIKQDLCHKDNDLTVKLFWRLCGTSELSMTDRIMILNEVLSLVEWYASYGTNPRVLHHLFETTSALIQTTSAPAEEYLDIHRITTGLVTRLISKNEAASSTPYCYQILAACLDILPLNATNITVSAKTTLKSFYLPILKSLFVKERWLSGLANTMGITQCLTSYIPRVFIYEEEADKLLRSMLDGFNFAYHNSRVSKQAACAIIWEILVFLPNPPLLPMLPILLNILCAGLQKDDTSTAVTLAAIICKFPDFEDIGAKTSTITDGLLKAVQCALDVHSKNVILCATLILLNNTVNVNPSSYIKLIKVLMLLNCEGLNVLQNVEELTGVPNPTNVEDEFEDSRASYNSLVSSRNTNLTAILQSCVSSHLIQSLSTKIVQTQNFMQTMNAAPIVEQEALRIVFSKCGVTF